MSENKLSVGSAILIFLAFLIVLFVTYLLKKIYYLIKHKKRFYIIPRISVKGIAYVAMVIAISIVIIMLLTISTADLLNVVFRAWPGTRVTIEGILIKIGGLLFGPVIGLFIGGMTDLLAVAMTAGVFHYGYLIAAMAYGLISGVIREIFIHTAKKNVTSSVWSTVILLIVDIALVLFIYWQSGKGSAIYHLDLLGLHLEIGGFSMMGILSSFNIIAVIVVWVSFFVRMYQKKRQTKFGIDPNKSNWFPTFLIVLLTVIVCGALVNILMLPSFDAQISSIGYVQWIAIRAILFIPEALLNLMIIYPIFKIVVPLISYDYHKDTIADLKSPVYVE